MLIVVLTTWLLLLVSFATFSLIRDVYLREDRYGRGRVLRKSYTLRW